MSKAYPKFVRLEITERERDRLETISTKTGIQNHTDMVRYALARTSDSLAGSPQPDGKSRRN